MLWKNISALGCTRQMIAWHVPTAKHLDTWTKIFTLLSGGEIWCCYVSGAQARLSPMPRGHIVLFDIPGSWG